MSSAGFWHGKVALVTGASAGLGKEIAAAFLRRGAAVAIAARRQEALDRTAVELRGVGGRVLSVAADVTNDEQVATMVSAVAAEFGRLDVLVNNAGRSERRAIIDVTAAEFQEFFDLNACAAVRCTRAAAPHLLKSQGHVVNIASLAAKVAPRYLGAYPASKFALAAYSQQLRLELGPEGLHVLLVCPGPLARDEQRTYGAEHDPTLPASAAQPGGGAKTRLIDPRQLAERIVTACERRQLELIVPGKARLLFALAAFSPKLGDYLLRKWT
jgi:NAD(P)-dependent dehydrogenase (short-subunit alcohol dehydrogenase family)